MRLAAARMGLGDRADRDAQARFSSEIARDAVVEDVGVGEGGWNATYTFLTRVYVTFHSVPYAQDG